MNQPTIPVSVGELIDKLTILQIKAERISDEGKLANVRNELACLEEVWDQYRSGTAAPLDQLIADLKSVNERLWEIEDDIRLCESSQNFDTHFVALARSVYLENDHRARIKKQINAATGSSLVEEKDYSSDPPDGTS